MQYLISVNNTIEINLKGEFNLIEQELQQGISISNETVLKIQICMKNVLESKEEEGVKLYNSGGARRVFALDNSPELVFKINLEAKSLDTLGTDSPMKVRYQNMINTQTAQF